SPSPGSPSPSPESPSPIESAVSSSRLVKPLVAESLGRSPPHASMILKVDGRTLARMLEPLGLSGHRRIVVLTGAGISVASGLSPYRGPGGLWEEHPELRKLADASAAARDPGSTWRSFGADDLHQP